MTQPLITVVTATHKGTYIRDCIRSVAAQTYGRVEHLVMIDGNRQLLEQAAEWRALNPNLRVQLVDDLPHDIAVNERIGAIHNRGIDLAAGDYIARLDDDNTLEPEHLESLYETLRTGDYDASYSWRYMWLRDGRPYLEPAFPWHTLTDPRRAALLYRLWVEAGVATPGSNLIKDKLLAKVNGLAITTVDASEWLCSRQVLECLRYKERMSYWELVYGHTEDDIFSAQFVEAGFRAGCSERATLNYFLGGHSNYLPRGFQGVEQAEK